MGRFNPEFQKNALEEFEEQEKLNQAAKER